ncbi:nli interacting factor-like phosphatase domain-containing protein [Cyclospora cayetanensis]|uniref:Mitochondrial import inner membrane translocase subunit TIM50 n=1 Tax=Cyclospora cayetanensis TaxID=88456 RepID=A0A1D3D344_9EIME|nr:nli interacting factor-like phosphatase domain-containing protein [Cyclospora cayetanensis]
MFRWKASKRNADPQKINPPTNLIPFLPPQLFKDRGKKTLVVDLDETLVRSTFKRPSRILTAATLRLLHIPNRDAQWFLCRASLLLQVTVDEKARNVYISQRPGLYYTCIFRPFLAILGLALFLDEVSKWFELVIFTASVGMYADLVVDKIDPKNRFTWRLYREYCTYLNGTYVKDLSLLGRDLCNVIIVDNSTQAYLWHAENAIPITSCVSRHVHVYSSHPDLGKIIAWIDDPHDTELIDIIPILSSLAMVKDIRPVIRDALLNLG